MQERRQLVWPETEEIETGLEGDCNTIHQLTNISRISSQKDFWLDFKDSEDEEDLLYRESLI